jgi:hypothetical protein
MYRKKMIKGKREREIEKQKKQTKRETDIDKGTVRKI